MSETVTSLTVVGAMLLAFALRRQADARRASRRWARCAASPRSRAPSCCSSSRCSASSPRRAAQAVARLDGARLSPSVATSLLVRRRRGSASTSPVRRAHVHLDERRHRARRLELRPVYYGAGIGLTLVRPTARVSTSAAARRPVARSPRCTAAGRSTTSATTSAARRSWSLARVGRTWSLFRPLDMVDVQHGRRTASGG